MSENEFILDCQASLFMRLLGPADVNLKLIQKKLPVKVILRDNKIILRGESNHIEKAKVVFKSLIATVEAGKSLDKFDLEAILDEVLDEDFEMEIDKNHAIEPSYVLDELHAIIIKNKWGKSIKPRSIGQAKYVKAISESDLVFSIGPAGCGKTFLAVAMGISLLFAKKYEHLILTRPVIEAGEKLGFLPGDIQAKVDPYFRPIYDAFFDLLDYQKYTKLIENGTIEIAPLAYMRGRTLENAFIILDEAQNTTKDQMKMFLTRFGQNSKVVVTGDITQIDLPEGKTSGLIEAIKILSHIPEISIISLSEKDIVRHPLVKKIVSAYENKNNGIYNKKEKKGVTEEKVDMPDVHV